MPIFRRGVQDSPSKASVEASILRDPTFLVAAVVAVVVALGFGLIVPVLPLFARSFGVGLFEVTLVTGVFAGVRLLANPYTGALSDRIGTRRAVGWGALIVAFSSLLTAAAPNYWSLVVLRGFGGFGSALFFNALMALVIRIVPATQRGRAVGSLQGSFLFGMVVGPAVGGLLAAPLGLRWPFVVYAVFCAAAGLVALRFLPPVDDLGKDELDVEGARGPDGEPVLAAESAHSRGVAAMWTSARRFCADPAFVAALVMMAASRWAATGVRFSLVPVFAAEVVGAGTALIGVAVALAAVTHLLVFWPAGKAADSLGRRPLGAPAFFAFAAVAATLGFAGSVPAFLLVMGAYGVATGLTAVVPPAVVADVVPKAQAGRAVGVLNVAGDLGSVLGPLVSGLLADAYGYHWGFGASAGLLVVGGLFAVRMRETLPAARAHSS